MNDLIEIIEDLEQLEVYHNTPGFEDLFDDIKQKWQDELAKFEAEMERQYKMEV